MSKTYYVINAVRSVHTRLARAQAPERHRFKQFILGGSVRLIRNRPVAINEEQFIAFKDELKAKVDSGAILVREGSPEGPIVNMGAKEKPIEEAKAPIEEKAEVLEEDSEDEFEEIESEDEVVRTSLDDFVPPLPPTTKKKKKKKGKD